MPTRDELEREGWAELFASFQAELTIPPPPDQEPPDDGTHRQ